MSWSNTTLPDALSCPACEELGADGEWSNFSQFWKFMVVLVNGKPRWLLGLVCSGHHHWVIQLEREEGVIFVTQRVVSCPEPGYCPYELDIE